VWELHQRSRELVPQGTMGWTGEVIGALVLILIAATPLFALDVAELTGATQPLRHPLAG
jgi:hypothetical protein